MNVKQTVPLLYVSDIDASRHFYCDGLGFEIAQSWEPDGKLAWCRLSLGGAPIILQQAEVDDLPPHGKNIVIYFLCEDADAVHADITARGIRASEPNDEFYGMRQVSITDPDGYALCFEHPVAAR